MSRMKGYPTGFPLVVHGVMLGLLLSGVLLVPTFLDMRLQWDVPWRLPNAGRVAVAAAHLAVGWLAMSLLGALASVHLRIGWKQHRQRASGAILMTLLGLLAATGIGIYYCGDDQWSLASSVLHTLAGFVLVFIFGVHMVLARLAQRNPVC